MTIVNIWEILIYVKICWNILYFFLLEKIVYAFLCKLKLDQMYILCSIDEMSADDNTDLTSDLLVPSSPESKDPLENDLGNDLEESFSPGNRLLTQNVFSLKLV